jgi:predicted MFS family arabinose efflux permease
VGGFLAFAAPHAQDIGVVRSSLPLVVYGSVVVVCRIAFAKVPDRLPPLPLGAASLLAIGLGLGLAAVSPTSAAMLIGAALMGLGVTFSTPAFFSAIFATASPSQRGAASGTASAMLDIGLGGGPIILGIVAESLGIPWAFGVGAAIALAGCFWTLALSRRLMAS